MRSRAEEQQSTAPARPDERAARETVTREHGGLTSEESRERFEKGLNPGGLHQAAVRHEGPARERPEAEEPGERKDRAPRAERHLRAVRRGP
jgi:hypothetical protein